MSAESAAIAAKMIVASEYAEEIQKALDNARKLGSRPERIERLQNEVDKAHAYVFQLWDEWNESMLAERLAFLH